MRFWRSSLIFICCTAFGFILVGRLFFLQVVNHGYYLALAKGQQAENILVQGKRGSIFARDHAGQLVTLAADSASSFVFLSPPEVENGEDLSRVLSTILAVSQDTILKKAQKQYSLHEVLKRPVSELELQRIEAAKLSGVYVAKETKRAYPENGFAAHVLGFVNQGGKGQYGVEEYYNKILAPLEGVKNKNRNPGSYVRSLFFGGAKDGTDVVLTIDFGIQSFVESILSEAKENLAIDEGSIIVMDPRSGKILALANTPRFNPQEYRAYKDFGVFQNAAVQKIFEPGSVLKPLVMAGAIQEGRVTPETTYEDTGMVQIGAHSIFNYELRTWGKKTMREVLQFSINTGAVFLQEKLGKEKFLEYLERFGMFEPTGIDLPGEAYSRNAELRKGREVNVATASFGQGIEMNPLQLMRAYTAFANNGSMAAPFVVESKGRKSTPVILPETATTITSLLVSVVEQGYGQRTKIPGYYIAGKTGTAQIPWTALGIQKAGYSEKTTQSFIGYGPAYNPQFLILVKLQNPKTKSSEVSAVPIFHRVAKYIIDYLAIPPDYEVQ